MVATRAFCYAETVGFEEPMAKPKILFACPGDGSRGLMAKGFARYYAGQAIEAEAAAASPKPPGQYTVWAMNEVGVDISDDRPRAFGGLDLGRYNCIVTISDARELALPRTTARIEVEDWRIPDPSTIRGRAPDVIKAVRALRYQVETRVQELLGRLLVSR
jgi:protein-tyrosine-phosphatase